MKNGLDVQINGKGAISSIQAAIGNGYPILITVDDGDHWAVVYDIVTTESLSWIHHGADS